MNTRIPQAVFLVVALSSSSVSTAATVVYDDEAAFLSQAGAVTLESFEGLPTGTFNPVVTESLELLQLDPKKAETPLVWYVDDPLNAHPTDGAQYVVFDNGAPSTTTRLDFSYPIKQLGFSVVDLGDGSVPGTLSIVLYHAGGPTTLPVRTMSIGCSSRTPLSR